MAKRKTTVVEQIRYVNNEGVGLFLTPKFTYEKRSFSLSQGKYQLLSSDTITESSPMKVLMRYDLDKKSNMTKIINYELVGAPKEWLEKNKYVNERT